MELNKIYNLNCLDGLKKLADNFIDTTITSPPYYGLRDYGTSDQIGLESTPELYIEKLTQVFSEVYRVTKRTGTLWINIADCYAGSGKAKGDKTISSYKQGTNRSSNKLGNVQSYFKNEKYKPKDLIGIPWMLAFALRSSGWYWRQDIVWNKPNPMPESVRDRCTKSHEYILLFSKSANYYYDQNAIMQPVKFSTGDLQSSWKGSRFDTGKTSYALNNGRTSGNKNRKQDLERGCPENNNSNVCSSVPWQGLKANKRSVWTVSTKPFKEAHFATFPEELIIDCIKAGCKENGVVLDPFMGAGTTALVARKLNRKFIGFELNAQYVSIAEKRLKTKLGLFA